MRAAAWMEMLVPGIALVYIGTYLWPLRDAPWSVQQYPVALSVLIVCFAVAQIVAAARGGANAQEGEADAESEGDRDVPRRGGGLVVASICLPFLAASVGFVPAALLYLAGTWWVLGERRLLVMVAVGLVTAIGLGFMLHLATGSWSLK